MKKILFISTLLPTRLGGMRSLFYNMVSFSRFFEVHFIRVKASQSENRELISIPADVHFSEVECPGLSLDITSPLFLLHWKDMMRIGSAREEIQHYIDQNGISVVVMHSMDVTFALRNLVAPVKSGYQIDSFATYYQSKKQASDFLPAAFFGAVQSAFFLLIEWLLLQSYDVLAYVSAFDVSENAARSGKAMVVSQCRDPPSEVQKQNMGKRETDIVILGRWEHPPNRDGLEKILSTLGKINGHIAIAGPNMHGGMALPKNAVALGMVSDMESLLSNSKICIVPVWYGAGLQTKVFDALRCGCKVLTTDFTKKGFDSNRFVSESIESCSDLAASANDALETYSKKDAEAAYVSYASFFSLNRAKEEEYVKKLCELAEAKSSS